MHALSAILCGCSASSLPAWSPRDCTRCSSAGLLKRRTRGAQIQPCPIKTTHPWEQCCYAHPHENARRRDPRKYRYIAEPCPDYKRGICLLVRHRLPFLAASLQAPRVSSAILVLVLWLSKQRMSLL